MAQDSGTANVLALSSLPDEKTIINDAQFIADLKRLKELRSFLIQEAINIYPEGSDYLSFGELNQLQYGAEGRAPTQREWADLEYFTQTLSRLLTEPLRQKFVIGDVPSWIAVLPIALALVGLAALITAITITSYTFQRYGLGARILPFYLIWLMSLGAIGSVAFIGMNALSVQHDITFDISNRRLMLLRITLGALFGLVLTLPFGFPAFTGFIADIAGVKFGADVLRPTTLPNQAMFLLLPFVLGFSTSVVIVILNRLVDSVQAFFGRTGTQTTLAFSQPASPIEATGHPEKLKRK